MLVDFDVFGDVVDVDDGVEEGSRSNSESELIGVPNSDESAGFSMAVTFVDNLFSLLVE